MAGQSKRKKAPAKPRAKAGRKAAVPDATAEFEKLLRNVPSGERFVLRLYVTGSTVRAGQAVANVRSLCEEYLPGRYDLEVVDIYQQPNEAAKDQIIAAPTLVKELPAPVRRLIGDLSDRDRVLVGLDLARPAENGKAKTQWTQL
jgi:circadian clock protein KaiB